MDRARLLGATFRPTSSPSDVVVNVTGFGADYTLDTSMEARFFGSSRGCSATRSSTTG